MITTLILIGIIIAISASYLIYGYYKKKHNNTVVPHHVGKKTIYLKRNEIEHFESLSRSIQRRYINKFEAQVKSGKYVAVYEKGKFLGYVKK